MDIGAIIKAVIWLGLVFLYAFGAGGKVPYFLFYTSLVIFAAGFVWSFINRRVSAHCYTESLSTQVGSKVKFILEVENRSGWPVPWVQCWVQMPGTFGLPDNLGCYTLSLKAHEKKVLHEELECRQRGRFGWGSMLVRTGDIFAVFTSSQHMGEMKQIVVLPEICDLGDDLGIIYSQGLGMNHGLTVRRGRSGSEFMGVRKYDSGDGISRIHWKASARSQNLMVKEFEENNNYGFLIILDAAEKHHRGRGPECSLEKAVTLAASLAAMGSRNSYGTGIAVCGAEIARVPLGYGKGHFNLILETLVGVRTEAGPDSWDRFSDSVFSGKRCGTYLITGFIDSKLGDRLIGMKNRGWEIVVFLLQLESFGGQDIRAENRQKEALRLRAGGISVVIVERQTDLRLLFRGLEYGNC